MFSILKLCASFQSKVHFTFHFLLQAPWILLLLCASENTELNMRSYLDVKFLSFFEILLLSGITSQGLMVWHPYILIPNILFFSQGDLSCLV